MWISWTLHYSEADWRLRFNLGGAGRGWVRVKHFFNSPLRQFAKKKVKTEIRLVGAKISVWQTGIPFEATVIVGFGGKKRVRKDCSFLMIYGKLSQLVTGWSSMWFWPHFIGSQQLHSFIPKNPQNNGRDLVTVVVSEKKKKQEKNSVKNPWGLRVEMFEMPDMKLIIIYYYHLQSFVFSCWDVTLCLICVSSSLVCLDWSGLKIFYWWKSQTPQVEETPKRKKDERWVSGWG